MLRDGEEGMGQVKKSKDGDAVLIGNGGSGMQTPKEDLPRDV